MDLCLKSNNFEQRHVPKLIKDQSSIKIWKIWYKKTTQDQRSESTRWPTADKSIKFKLI